MSQPTLAATMTPFPYSVPPAATLAEARKMMAEHGIHHLPVAEGDRILGVIAMTDLFAAGRLAVDDQRRVDEVADQEPYVVDIHTHLHTVVEDMAEKHVGVVIVTRNDKLAGILTHTDVCRLAAELLDPPPDKVA